MIHIHQVSFSYSGNVAVLDNISLHLEPGGVHILAGANGSGKSTLLALMAGLYLPKAGWIGIDGKKGEAIRDLGRWFCRNRIYKFSVQRLRKIYFWGARKSRKT